MIEHADIQIRHYESRDFDEVKAIFGAGMLSLMPYMLNIHMEKKMLSASWNHPCLVSAPLLAAAAYRRAWKLILPLYIGTAITSSFLWYLIYRIKNYQDFHKYVGDSIDKDLSNIPTVYQANGGCFLVATLKDRVVGIVGGEFKEVKDGKRIYELRRMSVDAKVQRMGIGKRLVQGLEKELKDPSIIFLYCSNLQKPAHALYQSQGFVETANFPSSQGFTAYKYEKHF